MSFLCQRLYIFPILLVILSVSTVIVTFSMAVSRDHVYSTLPYITDLGARYPEGSYFAVFITIIAILVLICAYIRYRKVRFVCDNADFKEKVCTYRLNQAALLFGFIFALLLAISANTGYHSGFVVGIVLSAFCILYMLLDVLLSFFIYPAFGKQAINFCKIILVVIAFVSCVLKYVFGAMALDLFNGYNPLYWTPYADGYTYHLVSSLCDWVFAITTVIFFSLFICDFYNIHFEEPFLIAKCETCTLTK